MTYRRGLGDTIDSIIAHGVPEQSVAPGMAAAQYAWRLYTGIPYTGNASTPDQLAQSVRTTIAIANGDLSATVAALSFPDPAVQSIALDYLKRSGQAERLALAGNITPAQYQQITGMSLTSTDAWKQYRTGIALQAIFIPGSGSYGHVSGDSVLIPDAVGNFVPYPGSIYDPSFDFGALTAFVKDSASHNLNVGAAAAATTGTQQTQEQQATQAATASAASGPPSGWRQGQAADGTPGWWGPDGLWYAGLHPWNDGTHGVSVTTFQSTPTNSSDTSSSSTASAPASAPGILLPTDPGSGFPPVTGPIFSPPPVEYAPPGSGGGSGAPISAVGGVSPLMLVGAVAIGAWFLFGRKKRA